MSSFLFSIASFSFTERYKERGTGEMREQDVAARKRTGQEKGGERERERSKREQREREGKQRNASGGTDVAPLPFLRVTLVLERRRAKRQEKRRRINQRKARGRDERMKSSLRPPARLHFGHGCLPTNGRVDRYGRGTGRREIKRRRAT